ncbi:MAG: hypothetical protein N3A38_12150 [Planctomycetota bacterium]|nr:hypothetical protein [Planctomycetota bacterium]
METTQVSGTLAEIDAAAARLPGIEAFVARWVAPVTAARRKGAEARVEAWDAIRACYEYGKRPEVQAQVAALNRLPDGRAKPGRPHTGHRLAMEALAAKAGIPLRTLESWQREWNAASAILGIDSGCDCREFSAIIAENSRDLPGWVESLRKDEPEDGAAPAPRIEDVVDAAIRRLDALLRRAGEAPLRSRRVQAILAERLAALLARYGLEAEIVFHERDRRR